MKNKLKKLMNKEEGFTLVELLAVIVILGIIVAIAIPAIGTVVDRAEGDAEEVEHALIKDAARLYVINEKDTIDFDVQNRVTISAKKLQEKGYLEPRAEEELPEISVEITRVENDSGQYSYEFNLGRFATDY